MSADDGTGANHTTNTGMSADEAADALVAGDATSIPATVEAKRVSRLLALHGLLATDGDRDRTAAEASLEAVFKRIEDEESRADTVGRIGPGGQVTQNRFTGFRWTPLAAAASIALVGILWWNITDERRAVATINSVHKQHGARRYDLSIERLDGGTPASTIIGQVDVDGDGRFVVFVPLPEPHAPAQVVFGRSANEWWILRPDGSVDRGPERAIIGAWIAAIAGDAPFPSMDATFATLESEYDVEIESAEEGGETYQATRTGTDETMADRVHITVNRMTRKVRYVRWEWEPPEGAVAQVRAVTARLAQRPELEPSWFEPEAHLPAKEAPR